MSQVSSKVGLRDHGPDAVHACRRAVQFDEHPATPPRAPEFNEHGDAILSDLGLDWDTIVDLKVRGVVA